MEDARPSAGLGDLALDWLGLDTRARLLIASDRRLLWSNEVARAMLRNGGVFEARGGRLSARNGTVLDTFVAFLEQPDRGPRSLCLRGDADAGDLVILCRELAAESQYRYFGLIMTSPDTAGEAVHVDLDRAFKLTASEQRMVKHMAEGRTADEIARTSGVSLETVRTHIRNIYHKVDVTSREALLAKLHPYRL